MLDGPSDAVEVYRNTATTLADNPADPADKPPALSYPSTSNARVTAATDSRFGGDTDYLISLAVPWKDLQALGLQPSTPALVWAGSSSTSNALDGDLACHDGARGEVRLSGVGGVRTIFDVTLDSDRDGYPDWYEARFGTDPASAASHPAGSPPAPGAVASNVVVEGGGGCRIARGECGALLAPLLLLLVALRAARRRSR